jgi:hypothetical protein
VNTISKIGLALIPLVLTGCAATASDPGYNTEAPALPNMAPAISGFDWVQSSLEEDPTMMPRLCQEISQAHANGMSADEMVALLHPILEEGRSQGKAEPSDDDAFTSILQWCLNNESEWVQ